ncbi:secreted phosphoprotein 24 [Alosa sapidissima]|uniref:secreted phosphoprotein 24 n=1 Tax=Alosa sapidissima TaxID=34773 RepID=UPI001C09F90F|nr:secreted phosphoprotein 24 [Alosa sapidissima]
MKVAAVSLVLILSLGASAFPLLQWDLAPQADKAIQMSLDQVNAQYGRDRLFRLTKGSVKKVVPLGMNTHDLMMNFAVRETDCLKISGADPLNCNFRRGFFVAEASCYSRVRVSAESSKLVGLRCSQADSSSSSSESSEEMMMERTWVYNPFAPREPVNPPVVDLPTAAPSRRQADMSRERAPTRGDNFNNHLFQ